MNKKSEKKFELTTSTLRTLGDQTKVAGGTETAMDCTNSNSLTYTRIGCPTRYPRC